MIYLDNNATTAVDPAVREAMMAFLGERYGNPSSVHRFGQESRQAVERARVQVAELLGCEGRDLIFTSGGTEADNAAIHGLRAVRGGRKVILTSAVEHSAVREPLGRLKKEGYEVVEAGVDLEGRLDVEGFGRVLRERASEIALASVMWVNNETGVIFDVERIGGMCREAGVPLHVDGVQAAGKLGMELRKLPVDLMSVSGHKFHGPKGVGALYVRRGVRWEPWQRGGPQERDRRGGTENVAGIVGMGAAAEMARGTLAGGAGGAGGTGGVGGVGERVGGLRDRLERGILQRVADSHRIGGAEGGEGPKRVWNTTNIGFAGVQSEAILLLLSEREICASAGAACSSGSLEPSHVLRAMGVAERVAHGAVRFSLSRYTSEGEIEEAVEAVAGVVEHLRKTLPV